MNSQNIIDLSFLKGIGRGSSDFLIEIIDDFIERIPPSVVELQELVNQNKIQEAYEIAHRIQPTFGMFGMRSLEPIILNIERKLKKSECDIELLNQLVELNSGVILAVEELKKEKENVR